MKKRCNSCGKTLPAKAFICGGRSLSRCDVCCDSRRRREQRRSPAPYRFNPDGMSYGEVAAVLGVTQQAVHQTETRALAKLRKAWRKLDGAGTVPTIGMPRRDSFEEMSQVLRLVFGEAGKARGAVLHATTRGRIRRSA